MSSIVTAVFFLGEPLFAVSFLYFVARWLKEGQRVATLESLVKSRHEEQG